MDFSKLIEWIKLSPKYLVPIGLVSGFLLFANKTILERFGLVEFVTDFRSWVGIVFLLASALILTDIIIHFIEWIKINYKNLRRNRFRLERFKNLTPEEKDILLGYLVQETRTQYFPINDGVVKGLEAEKIIFRSSNIGELYSWSFNIQPWAWEYLNKHSELLELNQMDI